MPKHFAAGGSRALLDFIEREPFGILVSSRGGKPFAAHVPFVVFDDGESLTLGLHLAKANPQWESLEGQDVLAIFQGPHAFISASWYAEPQRNVPTWNYSAVHCIGSARLTDAAGTTRILRRMVEQFEPSWRMEGTEPGYVDRLLQAIVGVEIPVTSIEGAFKYSQNRTPEDRRRVMDALAGSSRAMDRDVAEEMQKVPR